MQRSTWMGLIGAACWLGLASVAVFGFVTVHEPIGRFDGHLHGLEESIGFAWGFAVACALCGSVTFGLSGRARWGIVMALALLVVLGLIAAGTIFGYPEVAVRWYGLPRVGIKSDQRRLMSYVRIGSILGLVSGAIAALVLVGLTGMSRVLGIRRLRPVVFAMLAPAIVVSIPFVASGISALAQLLDLKYWGSDDRAIMGASIGATTGIFSGLLLALLLSRMIPADPPAPPEIPT